MSRIAKVEASDPTNSRQRITYTIFSGNENHVFSINRHTGKKQKKKLCFCSLFFRRPFKLVAGVHWLWYADVIFVMKLQERHACFHHLSYANSTNSPFTHPFYFPQRYPKINFWFIFSPNNCLCLTNKSKIQIFWALVIFCSFQLIWIIWLLQMGRSRLTTGDTE